MGDLLCNLLGVVYVLSRRVPTEVECKAQLGLAGYDELDDLPRRLLVVTGLGNADVPTSQCSYMGSLSTLGLMQPPGVRPVSFENGITTFEEASDLLLLHLGIRTGRRYGMGRHEVPHERKGFYVGPP